jgi:hypothetical protein
MTYSPDKDCDPIAGIHAAICKEVGERIRTDPDWAPGPLPLRLAGLMDRLRNDDLRPAPDARV